MMHCTQRLAMNNGRVAFESGLSMICANPYRKSAKSHTSFERGYREAERAAASPGEARRFHEAQEAARTGVVTDCDGAGGDRGI